MAFYHPNNNAHFKTEWGSSQEKILKGYKVFFFQEILLINLQGKY